MDKKNIVFIATSLDGYIAGKNGELDWLHAIPNPDNNDMGYNKLMQEIDAIVMGRTTFETVLGFGEDWPYQKHVFVLTTSLKNVPEKLTGRVTLLSGSPKEVLTEIHDKDFHKLYIDGGRTVQQFLAADRIDELRITTIPILLGGGFSLFGESPETMKFELIHSEVFIEKVVQSHYRRKH